MAETLEDDHFRLWSGKIITQLLNTGHFLVDIGQFDQAIACFETLSWGDDSYENGDYAFGFGRAFEGKGDLAKALEWYRIAFENNPPIPGFRAGIERVTAKIEASGCRVDDGYRLGDYAYGRGQIHEADGRLSTALMWYRTATKHNQSVPEFKQGVDRVARKLAESAEA